MYKGLSRDLPMVSKKSPANLFNLLKQAFCFCALFSGARIPVVYILSFPRFPVHIVKNLRTGTCRIGRKLWYKTRGSGHIFKKKNAFADTWCPDDFRFIQHQMAGPGFKVNFHLPEMSF